VNAPPAFGSRWAARVSPLCRVPFTVEISQLLELRPFRTDEATPGACPRDQRETPPPLPQLLLIAVARASSTPQGPPRGTRAGLTTSGRAGIPTVTRSPVGHPRSSPGYKWRRLHPSNVSHVYGQHISPLWAFRPKCYVGFTTIATGGMGDFRGSRGSGPGRFSKRRLRI
jgi:hypothetical protein